MRFLLLKIGVLLLIPLSGYCQSFSIPLVPKNGTSFLPGTKIPTTVLIDYSSYKGIDSAQYKSWTIRYFAFNNTQRDIEKSMREGISIDRISAWAKKYNIDTTYTTFQYIKGNTVSVFVGLDEKSMKHVIVDANHNMDFSDDKVYVFDLNNTSEYPSVKFDMDYFDSKIIKNTSRTLTIDAFAEPNAGLNVTDAIQKKLNINFLDKSYQEGFFTVAGKRYRFDIRADHLGLHKNDKYMMTIKLANDVLTKRLYNHYTPDTIAFNRSLYKVDSLTNKTLHITYLKKIAHDNGAVKTLAPDIEGEELNKGYFISLNRYKGKYLVIDFWGSWCMPCINALPELTALHEKYKSKGVKFLSIAFDEKKDIGKLKSLIVEKGLNWEHIFVERKGIPTIMKDYLVQAYPTTLLIDPKGRVVLRDIGAKVLSEIDDYLIRHNK